jgi:hypothetical protein
MREGMRVSRIAIGLMQLRETIHGNLLARRLSACRPPKVVWIAALRKARRGKPFLRKGGV